MEYDGGYDGNRILDALDEILEGQHAEVRVKSWPCDKMVGGKVFHARIQTRDPETEVIKTLDTGLGADIRGALKEALESYAETQEWEKREAAA